jgi:tetratricopeptide (TPR) repeat protein
MQKRYDEAEPLARATLAAAVRTGGPEDPNARLARNALQAIFFAQARYADAEPIARQIVESSIRRLGNRHPDTLTDMHNLATVIDRLDRYDEAESLYQDTIGLKQQVLGVAHPSTIRTTQRLATMYEKQKRFEQAEARLMAASEVLQKGSPTAPETAAALRSVVGQLINLYETSGRPDKAKEWRNFLVAQ